MSNKKHEWQTTDNQGHSMQCENCGESVYIQERKHWDETVDAECSEKLKPVGGNQS